MFFEQIPKHRRLLKIVSKRVAERRIRHLFKKHLFNERRGKGPSQKLPVKFQHTDHPWGFFLVFCFSLMHWGVPVASAQINGVQACECTCQIGSPPRVLCPKNWTYTSPIHSFWSVRCDLPNAAPWCEFRWSCPNDKYLIEQSGGQCPTAGQACKGYGHPLVDGTGQVTGQIVSCRKIVACQANSSNGPTGGGSTIADDFGKAAETVVEEFCKSRSGG